MIASSKKDGKTKKKYCYRSPINGINVLDASSFAQIWASLASTAPGNSSLSLCPGDDSLVKR